MKFLYKYFLSFVIIAIISGAFFNHSTYSWGFFAHKKINRMAVFTLPPEMIKFYKKNIEFITEHAVDPDKRRYSVDGEAAHHYIDIDHYTPGGEDPFKLVPQKWKDAVAKFTEDTLQAYGIVPWHVNVVINRLTKAFEEKNYDKILHLSADLGHYIGDSHVPLHCTENYNGDMTGQHGIHGFWESRIPELKSKDYNFFVGRAQYISHIQSDEWETIKGSFGAKDSVLDFERELNAKFPQDKKYTYENRGNVLVKAYSEEYTTMYDNMLDGMVERRMTRAILKVGSYWYTAWVNAGQPSLNDLLDKTPSKKTEEEEITLDKAYHSGKIKGRDHDD